MYPIQCKCGEYRTLPDVLICPFCHKCLANETDNFGMKHIQQCALKISPHVKSKRGPGRPPKQEYEIHVGLQQGYQRRCTNCGFYGCQGGVEGYCERWVPMNLERCHYCGRIPSMYPSGDGYIIECGDCRLKMFDENKEKLIARWNRV